MAFEAKSQVFWTENFGTGCDAGQLATNPAVASPNGLWSVSLLTAPVVNSPNANEWFISGTEDGLTAVGNCAGFNCTNNNRTMHISANQAPNIDIGPYYIPANTTNKRVESPNINCTGFSGIQVSFKYILEGLPGQDFADFWYFDGLVWANLGLIAPPPTNTNCPTIGEWAFASFGLPASANNNPNIRIGFRWVNQNAAGADPAIAIDDIELSAMTLTLQTVVPCPQQTITANVLNNAVGVTGYTWTSIPNTVTFTPTNAVPTAVQFPTNTAVPTTYTIILLGSELPGGAATATAVSIVTVNPQLPVFANPVSQTVCPGATATITASGANTYTWSQGVNGPAIGTGSTVVVSFPTPSVVSYFVQGELGMCLSNSVISNVTYSNVGITLTVTPQSVTVCPGNTIQLNASGANSYTWSIPGNPTNTPVGDILVDSALVNGVYIYTVNGTSGGCSGTGTASVFIQNIPVSMTLATTPQTLCAGTTVTLSALGAANYTWLPNANLTNSVGASVEATPTIVTTYTVFGEAGGCTGNAQITVSVIPGPPLNILSTANAVCTGYTSTLTATGGMAYSWTGTTFTGSINQPSISAPSGDYTVVATSTMFACPSIQAIKINTMSPLNISVSQNNFTTCIANNEPKFSKPVVLNATGGSSYVWAPCLGGNLSICIGNSVIARPHTTTQYTVSGYSSVCSGTALVTVTVIPQSTINVQPPMPIMCIGSCINFSVVNTNSTLPKPYTYSWTVPFNVPTSIDNILSPTVVACPTVNATYTVEMKDFRNCVTEPVNVSTTVIPQPITSVAIPTINGVPTNSICYVGDIVGSTTNTLALTAVNSNTNPPLLAGVVPTYTWYNSSTPTNSLNNDGSILTPTSAPTISITAINKLPSIQTYTLRTSFNGVQGCFSEDTISVRVVDCRRVTLVTFTTTTANDTICTRQCVTFTSTTDAGEPQTFTWTVPGGAPNVSYMQSPTICFNLPGKYNVILAVDNPYGPAVQSGTLNFIKVVDVPNVTIIPPGQTLSDTTIQFGSCVELQGSGASTYMWGPNYNISNLFGSSAKVCPHKTTQYILTGYNSAGCASSDTINVIVIEDCGEMFVPNAFSPNGQDHPENETVKVYGYCLETLTFQIFNRWGQKVFETNDQKVGWDGTFNGEDLNSGVYVYRLEGKGYDGKGYSFKGNITLIR